MKPLPCHCPKCIERERVTAKYHDRAMRPLSAETKPYRHPVEIGDLADDLGKILVLIYGLAFLALAPAAILYLIYG